MSIPELAEALYDALFEETKSYDTKLFQNVLGLSDRDFIEFFRFLELRYGINLYNFLENNYDDVLNDETWRDAIQNRCLRLKLYEL